GAVCLDQCRLYLAGGEPDIDRLHPDFVSCRGRQRPAGSPWSDTVGGTPVVGDGGQFSAVPAGGRNLLSGVHAFVARRTGRPKPSRWGGPGPVSKPAGRAAFLWFQTPGQPTVAQNDRPLRHHREGLPPLERGYAAASRGVERRPGKTEAWE